MHFITGVAQRFALTGVALASVGLLAACGVDKDDHAKSQTLHYASTKDIRNIDPHLYQGEMAAQAMVFEPLVMNTAQGPKPWLAQSWQISDDGRTYTFHLRRDVHFTDGTPFNAQAVQINMQAVMANAARHAWLDIMREIEGFHVVDDYTWQLRLQHPYYPTLIELGLTRPFRFNSPACLQKDLQKPTCLIGTGPWIESEHEPNHYALFKRNDAYWGAKPALHSIRWHVMGDPQTMLLALQNGEIDLIMGSDGDAFTADAFTALEKDPKLRVALSAPMASRTLLLNSNHGPTKDPLVREAISYAVDRQAIVSGVLNNIESPATTLFAKNVPYCNIELTQRDFDSQRARQLLEKAGYTTVNAEGIRMRGGVPLALHFYYNANNVEEKAIAETLQAQLKAVGIQLNIVGEEKQRFLDRQQRGDFDMQYALSWGAPYDPQSFLSSWRQPAHGDYQAQKGLPDKAQIDAQITALMTEPNEARRQALVTSILTRVTDEAIYVPLSYARVKAIYNAKLQGVDFAITQYEIPFEKMAWSSASSAQSK